MQLAESQFIGYGVGDFPPDSGLGKQMTAKQWRCRVYSVRNFFPSYVCGGCSRPLIVDLHKHHSSPQQPAHVQFYPMYPVAKGTYGKSKGKGEAIVQDRRNCKGVTA